MGIRARLRDRRSGERERGAAIVEMAFVMVLLILLLFGIIEFAWLFGLNNDVRHGAREGARFAAVDQGDNNAIHQYICQTMEPLGGAGFDQLRIELDQLNTNGVAGIQIGDTGRLRVEADINSLSGLGMIEAFLPADLGSTIDFRIEQGSPPIWSPDGGLVNVSC